MLTDAEIRRLSGGTAYERGCRYQAQGAVRIEKADARAGAYAARVRGSGDMAYHVYAGVREGRVRNYACNCPANGLYEGACKHVVALLKEIQKREAEGGFAAPSRAAGRMFSVYAQTERTEGRAALEAPLTLEATLCLGRERRAAATAWLEFRIGRDRLYVMRALRDFIRQMEDGISVQFGKGLTVRPAALAFAGSASEALWTFLREAYDDERSLRTYSEYFRSSADASSFEGKRLRLTPTRLVRFLTLMREKTFLVEAGLGGAEEGRVAEGAPPLLVEVEARDGAGRVTLAGGAPLLLLTRDGAWAARGAAIYHVPPERRAALTRLVAAFEGARRIDVDEARMGDFFSIVLPGMRRAAEVRIAPELGARYEMEPLAAEVRLDYFGDGLAAEMTFRYGAASFDPLSGRTPALPPSLIRDAAAEAEVRAVFDTWGFTREAGRLVQPEEEAAYDFLRDGLPALMERADVFYSDRFTRRPVQPMPPVTLGVSVNQDRLLELSVSGQGFDFDELAAILRAARQKRRYCRLKDHTFLSLDTGAAPALAALAEETGLLREKGARTALPLAEAFYIDTLAKETPGLRLAAGRGVRAFIEAVLRPDEAELAPPGSLAGVLRDYQATGFRWLFSLAAQGLGGILADDMGLGKTLQAIALLLARRERADGGARCALVVAPTSLTYNWLDELARFAPELRAEAAAGTKAERRAALSRAESGALDVLVTTYAALRRDIDEYSAVRFHCAILDEAQHIKTPSTQAAKAVKRLRADSRFALTGTPIENTLTELWSIFDFLLPGYLGTHSRFRTRYETPIVRGENDEAAESLRRRAAPFILRRLKRDVLAELPDKIESRLVAEMTAAQTKVYQAYLVQSQKELAAELSARGFDASRVKILALLTRLRQIACDPALFLENYEGGSGKLDLLEEVVREAVAGGHRLLVFSQFTALLRRVEARLAACGVACSYLDGRTPPAERLRLVKAFNAGAEPVFLISLKAGGTGLNLTGADMVVHCDPWWNPAVEEQAADRAYRIGQQHKVQVLKLVAKDTVEEKIFALQERKKALVDRMIRPGGRALSQFTEQELRALFD